MTVVSVTKNPDTLTMTFVAEFDAPIERIWELWSDPRQLERWWGPPMWPATFEQHELVIGSESRYFMTGPDGEKAHGWWEITAIDAPNTLAFDDGFADANGDRDPSIDATRAIVTLERTGGGTRMTTTTSFTSVEHLEQLLQMGMEEGMREAMGQIDGILAEVTA